MVRRGLGIPPTPTPSPPGGGIAPTLHDPRRGARGGIDGTAWYEVGRGTRCGIEARPEVKRPHTARPKPQYAYRGAPTPPTAPRRPPATSAVLDRRFFPHLSKSALASGSRHVHAMGHPAHTIDPMRQPSVCEFD